MNFEKEELRSLFSGPFDEERWAVMLAELFGARQDPKSKLLKPTPFSLPDAQGWYLGSFTTADGYLVGLFRFETDSVRRRRVGLRNLLRPMLRGQHDAALAVFTERGSPAWRFSFVCDLKGDATAAKRFTYVFGDPSAPYRTPEERFLALRDSREAGKPVSFGAMTAAFSVEALSDEFFRQYKEHYETFVSHVTGKRFVKEGGKWVETEVAAPHPTLYDTFGRDDKLVRDYVKKLLGRLVFLHFLQKKGWMGAKNGTWTSGDPAFLLHLFERSSRAQKDDFLDAVLEKLFFEALNTDRPADGDRFDAEVEGFRKARIPYLNGGLFERDALDALRVKFPADFFAALLRFFADYNFTIDENDADEAEVGIDPEMLGRIFENLLEDNKDKGAFYTPKEIVRYMCRQSLLAHLSEGEDPATAAAIAAFLDTRDPGPLSKKTAARLAAKLRDVKICDPAIGSGAFPMGLLRELFALRSALEPDTPDIKRQIIENNIYGVDIEKGAVDIARLRFWLALVVDADAPTPLPNLDFKIMQGNSLVESWKGHDLSGIADAPRTKNLSSEVLPGMPVPPRQLTFLDTIMDLHRKRLRDLLHEWFACSDHRERTGLRKKIRAAVEDIFREQGSDITLNGIDPSANADFFLWHLWFAEVFDNGGFDIVIGNPPYIQLQANKGELAKLYQGKGFKSFFRMGDIYCLFYEQAFRMAHAGGFVAYITPNTWLQSIKFDKFRKWILNAASLYHALVPRNVFEAVVDTDIFFFRVGQPSTSCEVDVQKDDRFLFSHSVKIGDKPRNGAILNLVAGNTASAIAEAILDRCGSFADLFDIFNGVKPFEKGKGYPPQTLEILRRKPYVAEGACPGTNWFPLMRGSLIYRYENRWKSDYWIKYGEWLAAPREPAIFEAPEKIIVRQTGDSIIAMSIGAGIICRNNLHILIPRERGIINLSLGILNSRLIDFIYTYLNPEKGEALAEVKRQHVAMLPFPKDVDRKIATKISSRVDRILTAKARDPEADTTALESEIDALVYQLYGLNEEEIATVEGGG